MPMRILQLVFGIMLVSLSGASAARSEASDAVWVYSLSWSPQYCKEHPISKEPQCTDGYYFLPRFLTPATTADGTRCNNAPPLQENQVEHLMPLVENRRELVADWIKDGGCAGMRFDEFAIHFDRASRRVIVPDAYRELDDRLYQSATDLRQQFVASNPGMSEGAMSLECAGSELTEVRICLDNTMNYRDCGGAVVDHCGSKIMLRGGKALH